MNKLWPEYGSRSYNLYSSPISLHKKELILAVHWKVSTYQRSLRLGFYSLEHVHTRHATPLFEHMFEPSRARGPRLAEVVYTLSCLAAAAAAHSIERTGHEKEKKQENNERFSNVIHHWFITIHQEVMRGERWCLLFCILGNRVGHNINHLDYVT